mmetsp:Transcript_31193/g.76099  ORF Transcript_31193/g.76099 Transcript_31193/m.76099 type:complete len:467 (+) Transcript_31193:25-1425(+)
MAAGTALTLLAFTYPALASLQGLYLTVPPSGQLRRVDVATLGVVGESEDVGLPLEANGYVMPGCVPSAVDQTGKWFFTLARPGNDSGRWHLVGMLMEDGSIRTDQVLPDIFPPSLEACDHSLETDGGWMVMVSAVVGEEVSESSHGSRLVVARFNYTFSTKKQPEILIDVDVDSIGLGGAAEYLTTSFFDIGNILFVVLEHGIASCNLTSGEVVEALKLPSKGDKLSLLPFDVTQMRTYIVLKTASGNFFLAYFSPEAPASSFEISNITVPVVDRDGSASAYLSDKREIVILSGTTLYLLSLNGTILDSSVVCGDKDSYGCPSSLHYEPFVFKALQPDKMGIVRDEKLPVVELLRQSFLCKDQDHFLRVDYDVWTTFLQKQDGFLSKETWASPEPPASGNCTLWQAIHWATRELWKSIPGDALAETDRIFVRRFGYRQKLETLPTDDGMGFNVLAVSTTSSRMVKR